MKRLVFGILAHVDSGKTTLSEALLYTSGSIRTLGRVDHGDAFLDNFEIERQRGITIFSKQAMLEGDDYEITLLDTPGHVDFASEAERTLSVLDYAILVISGTEGVQAHTETLWRLLERHDIPVFVFINKMDIAYTSHEAIMSALKKRFGEGFVDFTASADEIQEESALLDDRLTDNFLRGQQIGQNDIAGLIAQRRLFPCIFGSALKLTKVDSLLESMLNLTIMPCYPDKFGARVFKVSRDDKGERLTYMKIMGGGLRVRDAISGGGDVVWEEKANQLRVYSGQKFTAVTAAEAGAVCAVTGLTRTVPGMGLGTEEASSDSPQLEPVLTYRLIYPNELEASTVLGYAKKLEEEDPQLKVEWNSQLGEIHMRLMGEVQLEVLQQIFLSRFGVEVGFGEGDIVYRETITEAVEGIGHYEPLRHYAEVRLLLEPGERGSGMEYASACSVNELDVNWQHLIMTHLSEREHIGVLTGSPVTDIRITLLAGRNHLKHTEGGDFREATYRAVRQGLKRAKSLLLEPYYYFRLEVPSENAGRAISDIQRMSGHFEPAEIDDGTAVITGEAPVSEMRGYQREMTSYTKGRGRILLRVKGYEPCHNQQQVIERLGYESDRDTENPYDSVFCDHGSGHVVPWYKVPSCAHTISPYKTRLNKVELPSDNMAERKKSELVPFSLEEEKILSSIFEMTYGTSIARNSFSPVKKETKEDKAPQKPVFVPQRGDEYLLVDGYNIIFAWDELRELAEKDLEAARQTLTNILVNYHGYRGSTVILVYDSYKVKGGVEKTEQINGLYVVYTKEKETADMYIERVTFEIARKNRVRVATSDGLEQMIILGHGAIRVPASELRQEVESVNREIRTILDLSVQR
ncbi:MAG: translation factor GTPase family protein [Clostridiaceae bacterium]|nr:translation factor GTPase family protein [Clostridiaceae bacterium]